MLLSALQIGVLVYLGFAGLVYFSQNTLVFQPGVDRHNAATPESIGLRFERLALATEDGETLEGWHVPAPALATAPALVLIFHGNAGSIAHRLDYLRMFHDLGHASLIIDYRGYGRSSGTPSEEGLYRDADAVWRRATETLGVPAQRIVVFGESLGGAVAAQLAAHRRPAALVLASTFTSVPDLGVELYPLLPIRILARIRFDTLYRLGHVAAPVMVMHSPQDEIIPYAHGQRLFAAAREPKRFLALAGGHNEGFVFGKKEWITALRDFLDNALGAQSVGATSQ